MYVAYIPLIFVMAFFQVGLRRIALSAGRGEVPTFGMLFSGGPLYLRMLGLLSLYMVGNTIGSMMLVLPGIAFILMFWLADFFLVDANTGVIESFGASFRAMKGQWGGVILFGLVQFLLGLAGVLTCGLGFFVIGPWMEVAKALLFLRVSGRGLPPMVAQQPMYPPGYGGPPPGYGGPPPGYGGPPPGYGGPPGGGGYGPPGGGGPPPGYGPR
jgi:uncharacterized membrane protein